jgi:hypothetical protein
MDYDVLQNKNSFILGHIMGTFTIYYPSNFVRNQTYLQEYILVIIRKERFKLTNIYILF